VLGVSRRPIAALLLYLAPGRGHRFFTFLDKPAK
jgi:hypothetical protein